MSRKSQKTNILLLFEGLTSNPPDQLKMYKDAWFIWKKSQLENLIVAVQANETCLMVDVSCLEHADRTSLILLTYMSVFRLFIETLKIFIYLPIFTR